MINPLATQLYRALLILCDKERLFGIYDGKIYFELSEADVAGVMAALGAYEDVATVARLGEGIDGQDERALETAKRLANGSK